MVMLIKLSTETDQSVTITGDYQTIAIATGVMYLFEGSGAAFTTTGKGCRFSISGDLVSEANGVVLSGQSSDVHVSAAASIYANLTAVSIAGDVVNHGTISGFYGVKAEIGAAITVSNYGAISGGVYGSSSFDNVYNTGTINGGIVFGDSGDELRNAASGVVVGTIRFGPASGYYSNLYNDGSIQGDVYFDGAATDSGVLVNAGSMTGNVKGGAAGEKITNSGKITGDVSTGAGLDAVINSGEIAGSIVANSQAGTDRVVITNTGHVSGGITTGYAADTIDTHLGTVGGPLGGGRGADTYVIAGAETITEIGAASGGVDIVLSYGDYHLGIGLENLSLFGAARLGVGNALNNYLTANVLGSTLIGGAGNDTLFGEDGDDTLRGGGGVDTFYEVDGQNTIYGGAGDDRVYLSGGDNAVSGGFGNDRFVAGEGVDFLSGEAGSDTVSYANSTSGATVSLDAGTASGGYADGDQLYGVENLIGTASVDVLIGSVGANRLDGGAANDTLFGNDGDDVLTGGTGVDVIDGGAGFDIADYATATAAIVLNGATVSGDLVGDAFNSIEGFRLSDFDDTFVAVYDISLTITGGAGNDRIIGKGAADRLDGDGGNDTLTGGGGADVFQFDRLFLFTGTIGWGGDTITDFQDGTDKIDLSHAFGIDDFSDLTVSAIRGGTLVTFSSDSILLSGTASTNITAADFIFSG